MQTPLLAPLAAALLACGGSQLVPAPAPPDQAASPPPTNVAAAIAPPDNLAFVLSLGQPAKDIQRIGALMPQYQALMDLLPQTLSEALGPGIGAAVDLTRPVHVAFGLEPEAHFGASAYLSAGDFGAQLPPALYLEPKSEGVQALRAREGESHPLLESGLACEVRADIGPNGLLTCIKSAGPHPELTTFLVQHSAAWKDDATLWAEGYRPLFREALEEEPTGDGEWETFGARLAKTWMSNVRAVALRVGLNDEEAELGLRLQYQNTADLLSALSAGAPAAGPALPPVSLPRDVLCAASFVGVDPASLKQSAAPFWSLASAQFAAEGVPPAVTARLSRLFLTGGPLAVAGGIDLQALRADLRDAVKADEAQFGDATVAATQVTTPAWWLVQIGGELEQWRTELVELTAALGNPPELRLVSGAKPAEPTFHVAFGTEKVVHLAFAGHAGSTLVAVSEDEALARRVVEHARVEQKGKGAGRWLELAGTPGAAGRGFALPAAFVWPTLEYYSAPARRKALEDVERLLATTGSGMQPIPIVYRVEREADGSARAEVTARVTKRLFGEWLSELIPSLGLL
jgi:hypothetical protein